MDNALRCSIIFMILHIVYINSGFALINPIRSTNYNNAIRQPNRLDSIFANDADGSDLHRQKVHTNFGNYDFDDYDQGGEELDSVQYSNGNTQSVDSDFNDEQYGEDESLMIPDKRSRHVPPRQGKRTEKHVDLCPTREERYEIKEKWRLYEYKLRLPYIERVCNHTINQDGYDRQYNRVCYSLGRTFEFGHGTHCFQRYIPREIEVESMSGQGRETYTETRFRYGCTCGWATDELGAINDYHYDKILNLCSVLRDKV